MELMNLGLVAILHKDRLLPIAAVDLLLNNGDDPPAGNTTSTVLTSLSVQSPVDPITTVLLGHHNPPITRLLLPPTYVPYFASNLTVLSLADNRLDSLPTTLWSLANLRELNLNHNALDHLSPFIGRLDKLVELHASHNQLKSLPGSLPKSIEVLDVSHNQFPWAPAVLTKLKWLRRLWISDNPMSLSSIGSAPMAADLPPSFPPPAFGIPTISDSIRSHMHPQSLRDLALQAVALRLRTNGLHSYCCHHPDRMTVEQNAGTRRFAMCIARDLRLLGAPKESIELWLSNLCANDLPLSSSVDPGTVTWEQTVALADGELGDYDPYAGQPNGASVAANIAQVPATAVDAEFGAMVWSKIKLGARQALRREWAMSEGQCPSQSSNSLPRQVPELLEHEVPPGIDPNPPPFHARGHGHFQRNNQISRLTIDTNKSLSGRQIHSCPVSPGIREWTSDLPLATPKSSSPARTAESPPGTPSFPSPPSAYASYCISQVIPSELLLSLVVPSATCDVCGNGIHRMLDDVDAAEKEELRLTSIQNLAGGNLVAVSWTVCGVRCWQVIQGQTVRRIGLGR